ncbi:unnamed protein product, partial [Mesorhabditis belari]|uniref:Mitochondrial ribosomal protein S36 n=1 Tax=Mesorhabditis belari TaxID=2138241 RepID=A0AAF3ECX3_9BILA
MSLLNFLQKTSFFRFGFVERLRILFGFAPATTKKSIQQSQQQTVTRTTEKKEEQRVLTSTTPPLATPTIATGSTPEIVKAQQTLSPTSSPVQTQKMNASTKLSAAARIPLIKFLGARLPRPNFNRADLPPLQVAGNIATPSPTVTQAKPSSIGPVGKIPRGHGIPETQLPKRLRRPLIAQDECDAINAGGSYGL